MSFSLSHLRVFGCLCFATLVNSNDKFGIRSEKCVLIGYSSVKKEYRLYSLDNHKFIFSRDVKFFKNIFPFNDSDKTPNDDERVDPKLNCDNKKSQSVSSSSSESGGMSVTADFSVNSGNDADSSDNNFATRDERVTTLEDNVFSKELPKGRKAIGSKWIYNIKYQSIGEIDTFKARLVAQGFGQKEGIDYEDFFCGQNDETDKGVFLALLVYVDDIIITGNNVAEIENFKVFLKYKFMIKDLGKLKYFLGTEVFDTERGICLNQRKYVLDLLSEYGMLACKPVDTPLLSKLVISNEATESDPVLENITDYQKLMGKLIYLTNIRPDISYDVHCLSQFMHSPLKSHLKTAFKILRYLKGCPSLGIHFVKTSGMSLSAFSDADWAKCVITRYCIFLNNSLISWKSKKQNTLSKSSTEAEYRALTSVTSEVIKILKFLKDLKIENLLSVNLHCDSNFAIKIAANPDFHERKKAS
ncbi:ribonuclease H-like domain-containing protein [Tanacetum coccineum]